MRPMLATPASTIPVGDDWMHEVKWDGMRVLADVRDGVLRLLSRTERDVMVAFPELQGLAEEYPDMLLDGEIVALRDGTPSVGALAERLHVTDARRRPSWPGSPRSRSCSSTCSASTGST